MRVHISWASVLRVLFAVAAVWIWLRLWQWVLLFIAAIFLAVTFDPLVSWLEQKRVRRSYGAPLVVLAVVLLLATFGYVAGASLIEQSELLGARVNDVQSELAKRVPAALLDLIRQPQGSGSGLEDAIRRITSSIVNASVSIVVAFVLTVYLLLDGRRTFEWFVAFFPPAQRARVERTASEGRDAVFGYMRGSVATSVVAGVVTYVVLALLNVPAALLLSVLAAILNFIPVIGLVLSAIPAVLLALAVSATTGLAVAAFYLAYNGLENYFIAPKVYGRELQLSDLAVLAAFAAGAELGGVIGALIALPLAAMYPTIERIWLADRLGSEVVQDHQAIQAREEH